MPSFKKPLILTAALALSVTLQPAFSQQAAQPPAQQADQQGLWQTRCAGTSRSAEALICEASQSVHVKETGQMLFKVDIIYPANAAVPVFQMQAPLGFFLPGKIKLAVDGTPMTELQIGTCDQRGCFLSAEANTAMIDAMKAGAKLQIDFAPAADLRQTIEVPLTGFSRAMAAIQ